MFVVTVQPGNVLVDLISGVHSSRSNDSKAVCCSPLDFVNILSFRDSCLMFSVRCLGFLQDVCHKTWVFLVARRFRWRLKSLTKHIYQKMWFRQEPLRLRLGLIAGVSFFDSFQIEVICLSGSGAKLGSMLVDPRICWGNFLNPERFLLVSCGILFL